MHLALTLGGLSNGVRLCQGRELRLHAPRGGVPLQVDGEPFNQESPPAFSSGGCEPFDFTLERTDSALMLAAPQAPHAPPPKASHRPCAPPLPAALRLCAAHRGVRASVCASP